MSSSALLSLEDKQRNESGLDLIASISDTNTALKDKGNGIRSDQNDGMGTKANLPLIKVVEEDSMTNGVDIQTDNDLNEEEPPMIEALKISSDGPTTIDSDQPSLMEQMMKEAIGSTRCSSTKVQKKKDLKMNMAGFKKGFLNAKKTKTSQSSSGRTKRVPNVKKDEPRRPIVDVDNDSNIQHQQTMPSDTDHLGEVQNIIKKENTSSPTSEDLEKMGKIFSDQELVSILLCSKMQKVMKECMEPGRMRKYMQDAEYGPKLRRLLQAGLLEVRH